MNTELKIGQRWRTRGGTIAYVHAENDGRQWCNVRFPWITRFYPNGTDREPVYGAVSDAGCYYDAGVDRRDLFRLLEDAPAAVPSLGLPTISWPSLDLPSAAGDWSEPPPLGQPDTRAGMVDVTVMGDGTVVSAGDSTQATTFGPLPEAHSTEQRISWPASTPVMDAMAGITNDRRWFAMRDTVNEPMPPEVEEQHAGLATNPKDAIGATKLPLHLWPAEATALGCLGMLEGALKYGRANFIGGEGVIASIYIDAAMRHLLAWFEGEENAHDTGTPHLANALATIAIVVKCRAHGKLIDDRNYGTLPNGARYRAFVEELTPHVKRLKAMFADKAPKHFTIGDVIVDRKKADDTEGGEA